jgi:hypothetical protein
MCLPIEPNYYIILMLPFTTYKQDLNIRGNPSHRQAMYVVKTKLFFMGDRVYRKTNFRNYAPILGGYRKKSQANMQVA